jgi:hypothetical protein
MWPKDSQGYYICPICDERINRVRELRRAVRWRGRWYHRRCVAERNDSDPESSVTRR